MQYPIVYDKFETAFLGFGLAILENAINVCVREKLNGEYELSFSLPVDDDKWQYITQENFVKVEGQLFLIREVEANRNSSKITGNIRAEHVLYLLLDEFIDNTQISGGTALFALTEALSGTPFSAGAVSVQGINSASFTQINPLKAINRIIETWGGELEPDNWTVNLLQRRGADNGVQFRYAKNLRSIKRSVNTGGLITRLFIYGRDGLTIESVNGGHKYIDSVNVGLWRRPKIDEVKFDISDATELLAAGQAYLSKHDTPLVSYEVDIVELKAMAEYGSLEGFGLGDDIRIMDEDLGIDIKARVVEYERYPLEPWRSKVMLANFRPGIEDEIRKLQDVKQIIDQTFTDSGRLSTYWLEGVLDTLRNQLVANTAKVTITDNEGIMIVSGDGSKALNLKGGIFAIANSKDAQGNWIWRTFGTGDGFTADEIKSGKIYTSMVQIVGEATKFYWDTGGLYAKDPNDPARYLVLNHEGLKGYVGSVKRLHLGPYATNKFGLELKDQTGTMVILDEDGILQTWQEGRTDNVKNGYPLTMNIYIPAETKSIHKALLRMKLLAFRAYETAAASGGGSNQTSSSGGGGTQTSASGGGSTSGGGHWFTESGYTSGMAATDSYGRHDHGDTGTGGSHAHYGETSWVIGNSSCPDHYHDYRYMDSGGSHYHSISYDGNHNHVITLNHDHQVYNHSHNVTIPSHSHSVTIPEHAHGIIYGIYISTTTATQCTVIINGVDRTLALGGPFSADQNSLNIAPYLTIGQWNTISIDSTQLGRIDATVFIQAKMGV